MPNVLQRIWKGARRTGQHIWNKYVALKRPVKIIIPALSTALVGVLIVTLIFLSSPSGQAFAAGVYTSSATDANGNTLLYNNTVGDTQYYDTTKDSSATTQQSLGVDPNWQNGVVRKTGALYFDGSNDLVDAGNPSNNALAFGTGSFSYGLWVKPTTNIGTWDTPLWKGGSSAGAAGFDIELGTGAWTASLSDATAAKSVNFYASSPALNIWHHLFVVVDRGTQTVRAYADGVLANTTAIATLGSVTNTYHMSFGAQATAVQPYNGNIDEARIYGRALSADEVAKLAAKQPISDANLAGNWRFDDLTGTTATDSSPYANNGTLMNGTGNSPAADGTTNGPIWVSGSNAVMDGFKGCGPESQATCQNPSGQTGAGNVSVTADSSTSSGNGYDLQVVNPPALTFDGSDDYVSTGSMTPFNFANQTFTVSAWVKGTVGGGVVAADGATGGWYLTYGNDFIALVLKNAGATILSAGKNSVGLTNGTWHNIQAVVTTSTTVAANNVATVYIDGASIGTFSGASGTYAVPTVNASIGARNAGASVQDNGSISDVRVYGRGLSFPEVSALYNAQPVSNLSLTAWWKLNEGTGTSVADSSGNGITGTLMNGTGNSPAADGTTNGPIWGEGPAPVNNTGTSATSPAQTWMAKSYAYRQQVNVANASGATLPTGYSVNTPVTWGSLLNQNQSRADNNDFRIFHQPSDSVRSISISGTSQNLSVPASTSLTTNNASVSIWVKSTMTATGFSHVFAHDGFSTGSPGYEIMTYNGTSNVALRIDTSAGTNQATSCVLSNVFNGKWNLLTYTIDSAGAVKGYLNGVSTCSTTYTVGTGIANTIAADFQGNSGAAESVDDARVYNAVLTPSQVAAIYNGGAGTPNTVASGLVGWWRLDEGSGQIINDSSGNGNNGYLGTTSGSDINDPTWNSTAGNGTPDGVVSTNYEIPRYIPKASALTFDGSATKVAITNPVADRVAMPSGTMTVWFNRSAQDDTLRAIYDIAGTGSNGLILMGDGGTVHGCTAGALYFQWGTGSGTWGKCGPVPTNGTWYQATATWNSLGTKLYINGSLYASDTAHLPSITLGASSYLGSNGGTIRFFNGVIGEARLYNKTLSAADVAQLYANASTKVVNPQANLLEAWRMDEGTGTTANDASGVGANGTITIGSGAWLLNQAITPSTQQAYFSTVAPIANSASSSDYYIYYGNPGEQNAAMSSPQVSRTGLLFDGVSGAGQDDYITVPHAASIDDLASITWSAWINAATSGQGSGGRIFDKNKRAAWVNSNEIVFQQNFAAGSNSWHTPAASLSYGANHLVTITYDSSSTSNAPIIYIDGSAQTLTQTSSTGSGAISTDAGSPLCIGNNCSNRTFDGQIDDARMYNRILTATEAADLYNSGNTPPVSSTGLVGWWKLDEATGTSAADSSGNSNTGTLTNFNFNTTDGWTLNPNLWQTSSVTTNVTNLPATQQAPRYFRYSTKTASAWTTPSWSTELPITSGPTALGATGVKVLWNPEGHYDHYDTFEVMSWVVEASSSTRGTRRSYPDQTNIIADGTNTNLVAIDIINAATNNLWMRVIGTNDSTNGLIWKNDTPAAVTALNGTIFAGLTWNTNGGVVDFSLASDTAYHFFSTNNAVYSGTLAQRNASSGYATAGGTGLRYTTNRPPTSHRTIAAQVINGKEFLVAANDFSTPSSNMFVVNDVAAMSQPVVSRTLTKVQYSRTSPTTDLYESVALTSAGVLYAYNVSQGGVDRWDTIATDTSNVLGSVTRSYLAIGASTGANSIAILPSATVNAITVNPGTSIAENGSNEVTFGTPSGAVVVDEHSTIGSSQVFYLEQTGSAGTSGWNSKGFGNVMETNGATYAKVPIDTALDPGMSDFTVEGWFKTSASCSSFCQIIKNNSGAASTPGWQVYINSANKLVGHYAYNTGVTVGSSATVNDGIWHHFAVERTGTTTVNLFLDGVSQGTSTDSSLNNTITSGAPTYIGAANGPGSFFTGQIDEVRISNTARYTSNFTPQKTEFVADANTMGLWHFNASYGQYFADVSGNGNNATLGATSAVSTDDPLHVSPSLDGAAAVTALGYKNTTDQGESLAFDGVAQYVNTTGTTSPLSFANQSFTVSVWVKTVSASTGVILAEDGGNGGWGINYTGNAVYPGIKTSSGAAVVTASSSRNINDGSWHMVTMVFTTSTTVAGNNQVVTYIDGSYSITNGTAGAFLYNAAANPLTIGARFSGAYSHGFFAGALDDVRVYGTGLTPAAIASMYSGGRGWNVGKDANLTAGYTFNEGAGQALSDYSGNGYSGTLGANSSAASDDPTWTTGSAVRDQPMLWLGTNDGVSVGAVTAVSLTTGRQIKSYTTSNSVLPGYAVSALSVGSGGLALIGTGGSGAWAPGTAGSVVEDPLVLASVPLTDIRLRSGLKLRGGVRLEP